MLFLILSVLVYIGLLFVNLKLFLSMSIPLFLLLVYGLPIVFNAILAWLQSTEKLRIVATLVLPSLAVIFYLGLAHFTQEMGLWTEFISRHTLSDGGLTVEIANSLFDPAQLIFMGLTYYGGAILTYFVMKKSTENKGVSYA